LSCVPVSTTVLRTWLRGRKSWVAFSLKPNCGMQAAEALNQVSRLTRRRTG
jgi:hypothetical protein